MLIERRYIHDFFDMMNAAGWDYVLIKNIGLELPDRLMNGKDIDILVRERDKALFEIAMPERGYLRCIPPNGRAHGWNFGYGMPEYQFWKMGAIKQNLFIDVNFKLCCKSLTPKTWIPLDESINNSVWKNKVFDSENNWWRMDDENLFVYLIVRSIFDKGGFSEPYITEIEKYDSLLEHQAVQKKLESVFFKYTERLLERLRAHKYDGFRRDYITFACY